MGGAGEAKGVWEQSAQAQISATTLSPDQFQIRLKSLSNDPELALLPRKEATAESVFKKHPLQAIMTQPDNEQRKTGRAKQATKKGRVCAALTRSRNKPIPFRADGRMSDLGPRNLSVMGSPASVAARRPMTAVLVRG